MDKYAVIQIGPFQYRIEEGKEYSVPKFEAEEGKKMEVDKVLAIADGSKFEAGTPTVKGIKVVLNILEQGKGEKINTMVYKAKSRYHKRHGLRQRITKFKVESIGAGTAKSEAKTDKPIKKVVAKKTVKKVSSK